MNPSNFLGKRVRADEGAAAGPLPAFHRNKVHIEESFDGRITRLLKRIASVWDAPRSRPEAILLSTSRMEESIPVNRARRFSNPEERRLKQERLEQELLEVLSQEEDDITQELLNSIIDCVIQHCKLEVFDRVSNLAIFQRKLRENTFVNAVLSKTLRYSSSKALCLLQILPNLENVDIRTQEDLLQKALEEKNSDLLRCLVAKGCDSQIFIDRIYRRQIAPGMIQTYNASYSAMLLGVLKENSSRRGGGQREASPDFYKAFLDVISSFDFDEIDRSFLQSTISEFLLKETISDEKFFKTMDSLKVLQQGPLSKRFLEKLFLKNVTKRNISKIRRVLEEGVDPQIELPVDQRTGQYYDRLKKNYPLTQNLLVYALTTNQPELFDLLRECGFDINEAFLSWSKNLSFLYAGKKSNVFEEIKNALSIFLEKGADINAKDLKKNSSLFYFFFNLKNILDPNTQEQFSSEIWLTRRNIRVRNVLFLIDQWLAAGAEIGLCNNQGVNPYQQIIKYLKNPELIKKFTDHLPEDERQRNIEEAYLFGAQRNNRALVERLLGFGEIDVQGQFERFFTGSLKVSSPQTFQGIIEFFTQDGSIDLNVRDSDGIPLLFRVLQQGNLEKADALIEAGADCSLKDPYGFGFLGYYSVCLIKEHVSFEEIRERISRLDIQATLGDRVIEAFVKFFLKSDGNISFYSDEQLCELIRRESEEDLDLSILEEGPPILRQFIQKQIPRKEKAEQFQRLLEYRVFPAPMTASFSEIEEEYQDAAEIVCYEELERMYASIDFDRNPHPAEEIAVMRGGEVVVERRQIPLIEFRQRFLKMKNRLEKREAYLATPPSDDRVAVEEFYNKLEEKLKVLIKRCQKEEGEYDEMEVFSLIQGLVSVSETCAGSFEGLVQERYMFNQKVPVDLESFLVDFFEKERMFLTKKVANKLTVDRGRAQDQVHLFNFLVRDFGRDLGLKGSKNTTEYYMDQYLEEDLKEKARDLLFQELHPDKLCGKFLKELENRSNPLFNNVVVGSWMKEKLLMDWKRQEYQQKSHEIIEALEAIFQDEEHPDSIKIKQLLFSYQKFSAEAMVLEDREQEEILIDFNRFVNAIESVMEDSHLEPSSQLEKLKEIVHQAVESMRAQDFVVEQVYTEDGTISEQRVFEMLLHQGFIHRRNFG